MPQLLGDSLSIAVVTIALNLSMVKFYEKKYKYVTNSNQEIFSYGAANIFGSVFQSFPSCASSSHCANLEGKNPKTQV